MLARRIVVLWLLWGAMLAGEHAAFADEPPPGEYQPKVAEASDEGEKALRRMRSEPDFEIKLFAAEPLLANPVAFAIDHRGRFYVAETFRLHFGVTDIRRHMNWLDDDLACRTVADRVAMYHKYLGDDFKTYEEHHDRVRRIEDRDGDGVAETATTLADGFHNAADGIGAGVAVRGKHVWYTCIPDLWLLTDSNDDGRAEARRSLSTGYGIHVGFLGHDLHGARFGPDGKLYFSIGDRGLRVENGGRLLDFPDSGTVLRCNADGSQLEVFASGLRNPQELAFDEYGNLFTGENNSDSGDKARFVYVMEGGDSGWRIGYQFITAPTARGPWNTEKLWHPAWDGQAAYIVPPLLNLADGPSGLCYYPGTGLTDRYAGHFFLADFRGSSSNSGVRSFAAQPKGAGFEVVDSHEFVWGVEATDVDFGPDSNLYVSDWTVGWDTTGKGRIYRVSAKADAPSPQAVEVKRLLVEGFETRSTETLETLLTHRDMRVRQEAQFALADRAAGRKLLDPDAKTDAAATPDTKALDALVRVAARAPRDADSKPGQLARVHAIWGLGQVGRSQPAAVTALAPLLKDADPEIRAQAAKVVGDARLAVAGEYLISLLADESPRVQSMAAIALGKLSRADAVPALLNAADKNADADPYLRHALVMGLAGAQGAGVDAIVSARQHNSRAARMAALLSLRRLADSRVELFLEDSDPFLVTEAARAIYDLPIESSLGKLAQKIEQPLLQEPAMLRALAANYRLGQPENARALASFAARADAAEVLRLEALSMLANWAKPSGRDKVVGLWRPLAPRDAEVAVAALRPMLPGILTTNEKVRQAGAKVAAELGITEVGPLLVKIASNREESAVSRVEAIRALEQLADERAPAMMEMALADADGALRAQGQHMLAKFRPEGAVAALTEALAGGSLIEQQSALATLAEIGSDAADGVLIAWLDKALAKQAPEELVLDILTACEKRPGEELKRRIAQYEAGRAADDPLSAYREALAGGDAARGKKIFFEKADVSCLRCHKIGDRGSEVGPELNKVAADKPRTYLLESIVDPNRQIAKGFETVVLATDDAKVHIGILKAEDDQQVRLITAEGQTIVVPKASIEERSRGQSAMPDRIPKQLTKAELRDLVEYLSTLK